MTLFIKLTAFTNIANVNFISIQSGFLFIETPKSGVLTTRKISSGNNEG
jgi:hypothetical protein